MTDAIKIENEVRLLRFKQINEMTGLPKSSVYALIKKGEFPSPIPITPQTVGWISTEVSEWIASRVKAARPQVQ
jgi:prophage regulatory protein